MPKVILETLETDFPWIYVPYSEKQVMCGKLYIIWRKWADIL